VVEQGIAVKYKDFVVEDGEGKKRLLVDGGNYLEKIIQLPFELLSGARNLGHRSLPSQAGDALIGRRTPGVAIEVRSEPAGGFRRAREHSFGKVFDP
jgi:hypothetical protein